MATAARLMRETHAACLVVADEVDGERAPARMLTDRDISAAVVAAGLDANTMQVGDFMSAELLTANEEAGIAEL